MIDHNDLDRTLLRFQTEAQLFLHGGEDRRPIRIGRGRTADIGRKPECLDAALTWLRFPFQREVVLAFEVRPVDYSAAQLQREQTHERRCIGLLDAERPPSRVASPLPAREARPCGALASIHSFPLPARRRPFPWFRCGPSLEAVFEQGLEHRVELVALEPAHDTLGLRSDIPTLCSNPARPTRDLEGADVIRVNDEKL